MNFIATDKAGKFHIKIRPMRHCYLINCFLGRLKQRWSAVHTFASQGVMCYVVESESFTLFFFYMQVSTRLELLTIHGGEHQGTLLHPYQIISLSVCAADAVRIMNKQTTSNFPWEPISVIKELSMHM